MNLAIAIKKGQSPLNSSAIPSLVWLSSCETRRRVHRQLQPDCERRKMRPAAVLVSAENGPHSNER